MIEHSSASAVRSGGKAPGSGDEATTSSPAMRRRQILSLLERIGEQSVEQLAVLFGVSGMTIRRDLQELADSNRVIRTHGGAAPASRVSFEFRFLERMRERADEKAQIATVATDLIQPGQSILLDSGTTTLAIARRLKERGMRNTLITTSLPIASELFGVEQVQTILLGGMLRKDSPDLIGDLTDQNLEAIHTDIAFIGADAIGDRGELFNNSPSLGRMLQRMRQSARQVYAVADHTKLGRTALMKFGVLSEWEGLITDSNADAVLLRKLKRHGVRILQPDPASSKAESL